MDEIIERFVAMGLARCTACELRVSGDEPFLVSVCPVHGDVEFLHERCAEATLNPKEVLHAKLRANARWN